MVNDVKQFKFLGIYITKSYEVPLIRIHNTSDMKEIVCSKKQKIFTK